MPAPPCARTAGCLVGEAMPLPSLLASQPTGFPSTSAAAMWFFWAPRARLSLSEICVPHSPPPTSSAPPPDLRMPWDFVPMDHCSAGAPKARPPAASQPVSATSSPSAHAASTLAITRSPVIRSLPLPRTIGLGQSTVLQSSVEGLEPLSFEWLKDGKPIPGETNASLVLNSVGVEQRGTYSLRVTNPWQSITSAPTEVRVLESLGFQILRAPLNRHLLRINAIGVNNAFVQFSPNQVDWYEYPEIQHSPTPTTLEFFPLLESDTGFWRLRIP